MVRSKKFDSTAWVSQSRVIVEGFVRISAANVSIRKHDHGWGGGTSTASARP